jgi:hypothetical protein
MVKYRSRLAKTEEKKNYRRAFIYLTATILILGLFFIFGIPSIARFAAFLTNIRETSDPVQKNDLTAPITPRVDPLPEYTNQDMIDIKGYTEPGASVIIHHNNADDEVLADKTGVFIFDLALNKGGNSISLIAKDSSGNESVQTENITITVDKEPPDLTIDNPNDGTEYFGTKQRQIVIEGTTEEGAMVTINDRFVVVDSEGKFTYLTTLNEGDNNFTIKSSDKAGNESEITIILKYSN